MSKQKATNIDTLVEFASRFSDNTGKRVILPELDAKLLAEKSGFSIKRVRAILRHLKNDTNHIKFSSWTNYNKLPFYRGLLEIKTKHPKSIPEVTKMLISAPFVRVVYELDSESISHIVRFCIPLDMPLPYWVEKYFSEPLSKFVDYVKVTVTYSLDDDLTLKYPSIDRPKVDATDWLLLSLLRVNAVRSLKELSNELGISVAAVYKRMQRLRKLEILQGYVCTIRWTELPSKLTPILTISKIKVEYQKLKEFVDILKSIKLIWAYRTLGETDFIIYSITPTVKEHRQHLANLAKLPGVLDVKTFFVTHSASHKADSWIGDFHKYYTGQLA